MTTWTRHLYEHDPLAMAKGESNGYSTVNIFGYNSSVGTTFIPAWENNTAYTYPASALPMTVNSDVADNGVVIKVVGLDSDYNPISATYTLNSSSPPTTMGFFRINEVVTVDGNGTGSAANDITLTNGGITYAKVRGGDGKSQMSLYTVPNGHSLYLYRITALSATANGSKYLMFRNYVTRGGVNVRVGQTTFPNTLVVDRQIPFKYEEKTDIQLQAKSSSGSNEVGLFAECALIKNTIQGEP